MSNNDEVHLYYSITTSKESWRQEALQHRKEKEQLISFLKENIRNRLETVKFYKNEDTQYTMEELEKITSKQIAELNAYQEVLDFVNKGGKDD